MAIIDGFDLATCLTTGPNCASLEKAIAEYDSKSIPRAKATLKMSLFNIDLAHSKGWKLWLYELVMGVMRWLSSTKA